MPVVPVNMLNAELLSMLKIAIGLDARRGKQFIYSLDKSLIQVQRST